ncbi:MAG: hypothetical protein ACI8YO_000820 [Gammaproteobacteria bacterium]|jgi:hypothetical protein
MGLVGMKSYGQKEFLSTKINGVNYVSPQNDAEFGKMKAIKRINANWVSLTPFTFLNDNDPIFEFDSTRNWMGDSIDGIKRLIKEAKDNGFKLMLKPHFIMEDLNWVGDFDLSNKNWIVWEENYTNYILTLAQMAEKYNVEILCVGTEFKNSVNERPEYWKQLISDVREVYSGKLTYAANWDNYYNIKFWADLDFIGLDAYFPLSPKLEPILEELEKSWGSIVKKIGKIAVDNDKQVIFTEYGYRSIDGACWEQWRIESVPSDELVNLEAQTIGYQALYNSVWDSNWMAGGFIWKWYPDDKSVDGDAHSNYSPQNKPAEDIVKEVYFKK